MQRFSIEQIARVYQVPPVFLQDLTHGTFSNTEQQDLHLVKHTIKRWIEQLEQELNLKLFPRGSSEFVEFSLDGLLRGDIKTVAELSFAVPESVGDGIEWAGALRERYWCSTKSARCGLRADWAISKHSGEARSPSSAVGG